MNIWIVLLIGFLILSPLTWLRPSRHQQGQMSVRMEARRLGISMQLMPQKWPHWLEQNPPLNCPQYARARPRGALNAWAYWQKTPGQWVDQWQEPCTDSLLLGQLALLPSDAYKVALTLQQVMVFWGEQGSTQTLPQIDAFLNAYSS